MRILITGSRNWTDKRAIADAICAAIDAHGLHLIEQTPGGPRLDWSAITVVHGNARGADLLAARLAHAWGMSVETHPADWARYSRAAGHRRNAEMVARGADVCLAFPLGRSRGTHGCMKLAVDAGIPVWDYGEVRDAGQVSDA